MRLSRTLTAGLVTLFPALLLILPASGANFLNPTSNDANSFESRQPIRVTSYQIGDAVFTGTTYNLTLAQDLEADYFVVMRGAAGANDSGTNRTPDQNYARVVQDPFGNIGTGSSAANVIQLGRGSAGGSSWQGQVTVVESLDSQATDGFTLVGVAEPSLGSGAVSGSSSVGATWGIGSQVGLYGGVQGGGVSTDSSNRKDHVTAWGRVWTSANGTADIERLSPASGNGSLSGTTTFTVYAVEWGSSWTIQSVVVSGTESGGGVDATTEYSTASISSVERADTFVIASGTTDRNRLQNGWEGNVFTLGDGVTQLTDETLVAVGAEGPGTRKAQVYVHTHDNLAVDYDFGTDGSIGSAALTGTLTVDAAFVTETYTGGSVASTVGYRLPLFSNSQNGNTTAHPRPMAWARHTASTQLAWTRSRTGEQGAYWTQSVDFGEIWR